MKRSTLSMLVLFLALWFAFSGPAAANVTKFTFWTFIPQHARFFDVMAEKWNELHPDRPVELESSVMPYDDMHNKLQIALPFSYTPLTLPTSELVEISAVALPLLKKL